ncbi:MAG: hypothetical protein JWP04_1810 [Belnapia sp.]|nr:hypothetical protein [Belnapia sp.]
MPVFIPRLMGVFLLAGLMPGCATITTGSTQGISVISEPATASCALQREGAIVGVVNPTPGTVQVSKSVRDISVRCTKPGYSAGVTPLPSQFQAATLGNILLGGVIGIVVDAASGAMGRYPETVMVNLPAEAFGTEQGRDAAFLDQVAGVRRNFQERLGLVRGQCGTDNKLQCDARVSDLETERDAELTRLEQLRVAARISG